MSLTRRSLLRSLASLAPLPLLTCCTEHKRSSLPASLSVFCAAGLRKPLEQAATDFQTATSTQVSFQFGGSGTLLSQLKIAQTGDLFVAADEETLTLARKLDVIREIIPLAVQTPVIAVQNGNPKGIKGVDDLLRADIRVALANPESASISKVVKKALGPQWDPLVTKATVMKPTVTEIAADLTLGAVDAAILWDSTIPQFKGLEAVQTPTLSESREQASIAVLASCQQPQEALRFARFLAAESKGGAAFAAHGFQHIPGDAWSDHPELILYSGGVNRPAVETVLRKFSDREGISLTTVFNGCGVLCASMKAMEDASNPKFPDVYYACDLCFVPPVAEQFPEAILLTETEIGIVVKPENPKGIKTLSDLAAENLRIGICNAEQSTLGFMTKGILKSSGLLDSIRKNVVVEVPTADFLVNQLRASSLDAAIVYKVNALAGSSDLHFIPLKHPGAKAVQPFAVRKDSPNRQSALRLLDFLKANRSEFESAGFLWRGNENAIKSKEIELPEWLKEK